MASRADSRDPAERRRRDTAARPHLSRRRARLRLSEFPRDGQSRHRAAQAPLDFRQGSGRCAFIGRRRVGRPRRSDRAGRRRHRIDRRAAQKIVARSRQSADRSRSRRGHRDDLQRADRRPDVRAGNRPARPHRNRQPHVADHRDLHRRHHLARDPGQLGGVPRTGIRAAQLLGDGDVCADGRGARRAGRRIHPVLQRHRGMVSPARSPGLGEVGSGIGSRRRNCNLAAAKFVRRISGDQRRDGRRVRHWDARGA